MIYVRTRYAAKILLVIYSLLVDNLCAQDDEKLDIADSNVSAAIKRKGIACNRCCPLKVKFKNPFKYLVKDEGKKIAAELSDTSHGGLCAEEPEFSGVSALSCEARAGLFDSLDSSCAGKNVENREQKTCVDEDFTISPESSLDSSSLRVSQTSCLRILFVEDDPTIRDRIQSTLRSYNKESSNKYKIESTFITHGFLAIEYLSLPESVKHHVMIVDNNMESFFSERSFQDETRTRIGEGAKRLRKRAGCEFGKFLRPHLVNGDESPSIYNRKHLAAIEKKEQLGVTYDCVYGDEWGQLDTVPFDGLIFLSTSDSAEEVGPENVALFDGLPPKLRYLPLFKKFLRDYEIRIDETISRF